MSFSSDEINYLIYRYLEESGLYHSAYTFGAETYVTRSNINGSEVSNGALIKIVQMGICYYEAEVASLNGEETGPDSNGRLGLSLMDAVCNDQDKVRRRFQKDGGSSPRGDGGNGNGTGGGQTQRERDRDARSERSTNGQLPPQRRDRHTSASSSNTPAAYPNQHSRINGLNKKQVAVNGMRMNGNNSVANGSNSEIEIDREKVRQMRCHESEVFICSWNPKADLIGTGSGDSTGRIWDLNNSESPSTTAEALEKRSIVLRHTVHERTDKKESPTQKVNRDVTSVDWDCTGQYLATGCYDGCARVWNTDGKQLVTVGAHKGPIFALRWNESGSYILSAGVDKSTIVWDLRNSFSPSGATRDGAPALQTFMFHSSSALDVDWIDETTFASCSTDKQIHVCRLGEQSPIRTYTGHTNEVNAIRYDRVSQRLASCSDDKTLKIWSLDADYPVMSVDAHAKEIYTIRWSPVGHMLASASFDHTVRIWDVAKKKCLQTLQKHVDPVYSVSFSPDGKYLASGSFDKCVYIWDVSSGQAVMSYTGGKMDGGIFEVGWNHHGTKVACSASDGSVVVLDVRNLSAPLSKNPFRPVNA